MSILKIITLISFLPIFLTSCFNSSWTEEQRKAFETKCAQTDSFNNVVFLFRGFDNSEFDSIWVKEYKDMIFLDSFSVFVWPSQNPNNKERNERSASIKRAMNIKYKYHFLIPGQKPYELANMKMVMWAQYTMASEGWGCVMGDYTIDGVRFEHKANPTFIKRDTIEKK